VKGLCGELNGQQFPVQSLSPAFMYDIQVPANEVVSIPLVEGNSLGLYLAPI
jgi:redox-sensitive bicupin YhaK (pirin superfamily)